VLPEEDAIETYTDRGEWDLNRTGPLAGIRVLAIEQFGAGPFCSLYLADAGAEVIKIEDPAQGGDVGRYVPPGATTETSLYFETFNRGKRSVAIDLKSATGRAEFERLVSTADVVFNNLRGDLPAALEITYGDLSRINPRIVCASLSAYGRLGDRASEPGYDALIQAEAGWAWMTGEPGGPPVKSGLSLVDYAAGLVAAFGIAAAVLDANRSGRGRDVDTSLYEVALSLLTYPATWYLSAGVQAVRHPMSAHPSIVPFQFFQTTDGYVAIACAKEKFFAELVVTLGLEDLLTEERFRDFAARSEHRNDVVSALGAVIERRSTADILAVLRGRVPCAPARSMEEALDPALLQDRGLLVEYDHPVLGTVRTVASPLTFDGFVPVPAPAPRLDGDRSALLPEFE
jgi:crotonobetainyl-CoA:carnitine CoA-transferase CaiB-like acyl-CoA transferase